MKQLLERQNYNISIHYYYKKNINSNTYFYLENVFLIYFTVPANSNLKIKIKQHDCSVISTKCL